MRPGCRGAAAMADQAIEDPRAWLRSSKAVSSGQREGTQRSCHVTAVERGRTATMRAPGEYQNRLQAIMHPHEKTGYKDKRDPCNRTDKRNGGEYRRYDSSYRRHFSAVEDKPIQFRQDGLPISARRVPGKPLMAPKLPSAADLHTSQRLNQRYGHTVSFSIGAPGRKDPQQFKSVYAIAHAAPHRALAQPNPGIAAEDAKRAHHALGLNNRR